MSEDQLKAFVEKVKGDTSLQEKLKAASDADAVVSIAKEEGFSISIDDIKAQLLELSDEAGDVELSDEELEGVAGGVRGLRDLTLVELVGWYGEGGLLQ